MNTVVQTTMEEWLEEFFLSPVDEKQEALAAKHISQHIEAIREELECVRECLDSEVKRLQEEEEDPTTFLPNQIGYNEYPIGYCGYIRDEVFEILGTLMENPETFPGLHRLGQFSKEGGIFKKVGGIQGKKYFQNAIQAGPYILDVAHDTVDPNDPSVVCSTIEEAEFENNDDFEQDAIIIESYLGMEVYPNIYFPEIAPIYPLLAINSNGTIQIQILNQSIIAANVLSNFKNAETFLTTSRFAKKRLPKKVLKRIVLELSPEALRNLSPTPSPEELAQTFENIRRQTQSSEFIKQLYELENMMFDINSERRTTP